MQMDFKFFMPNFLQSLFIKLFTAKVFYYSYNIDWYSGGKISYVHLPYLSILKLGSYIQGLIYKLGSAAESMK